MLSFSSSVDGDVRRYKSKFSSTVRSEGRQDKASSRTMVSSFVQWRWVKTGFLLQGPAKVQLSSPQDFLKKHSKEPKLSES